MRSSRKLDEADRVAQRNLSDLYQKAKQSGLIQNQEELGDLYGGGQSLMSAYIGGRVRIGPLATLKFARIFKTHPKNIRPDFDLLHDASDLTPEAVQFAIKFMALPERFRRDLWRFVETVYEAQYESFLASAEDEIAARDRDPATQSR